MPFSILTARIAHSFFRLGSYLSRFLRMLLRMFFLIMSFVSFFLMNSSYFSSVSSSSFCCSSYSTSASLTRFFTSSFGCLVSPLSLVSFASCGSLAGLVCAGAGGLVSLVSLLALLSASFGVSFASGLLFWLSFLIVRFHFIKITFAGLLIAGSLCLANAVIFLPMFVFLKMFWLTGTFSRPLSSCHIFSTMSPHFSIFFAISMIVVIALSSLITPGCPSI
mmetsp:Transcript_22315/g.25628  ORF Transcript_22315/g.25628 Transcript_22315/m.25628 type:complete len:221 (-) Transcript_22315:18-680(-)